MTSAAGWMACLSLLIVVKRRRQDVLCCVCLALCAVGLGVSRGVSVRHAFLPYQRLALHSVVLSGRVTGDAIYGDHSQLTFGVDHVHLLAPKQVHLPGELQIAGFGTGFVFRGDAVLVRGKLFPTRGNAVAHISFAELQLLRRGTAPIDELRRRFTAGLQTALPEPQASFGLGLLIGQRSTLPADTAQVLLAVGLTHLIAVSGYNLTIMVAAVRRLLGKRSAYQTTITCLVLVGLFLLLVGSSPSIVRASIISMLSIVAWYYGRIFRPLVLLLLAAAITGYASPQYVWGNVSWTLSFLAFFGVLIVAPLVTKRICGEKEPKLFIRIMIETLCAELITAPYMLHIFGQASFVTLPANVLIAAVVPLAMLCCLIAGITGMLVPATTGWFAWPAKWVLSYMLDMATMLSRIPHAFVQQLKFSLVSMLITYALLASGLIILRRPP